MLNAAPAAIDLSPSIPAIVAVTVAVLAILGGTIAAYRSKPTELMAAALAAQKSATEANSKADTLQQDFTDFREKIEGNYRIVTRGFRALWRQMERLRQHWGDGDMPALDVDDLADIQAARELLEQQEK